MPLSGHAIITAILVPIQPVPSRIPGDKPPDLGIVKSRAEIIQPRRGILRLPGELIPRIIARMRYRRPKWRVLVLPDLNAILVRDYPG